MWYELFESDKDTFEEISFDQLSTILNGPSTDLSDIEAYGVNNRMDFTPREFSEISNLFIGHKVEMTGSRYTNKKGDRVYRDTQILEIRSIWVKSSGKNTTIDMMIFKFDDEWFYIRSDCGEKYEQYRCDQLYGLLDCLRFIIKKYNIS